VSKRSGDQIAYISVGSAAYNYVVYCCTHNAWTNPAMQGKGIETKYSEMLA
jgi:hypothetical protein